MSTLVNITQATAELSLAWATIHNYITSSGLQPEHTAKHGKRLVPLYDLEKLREGLKTHIEAYGKKAKADVSSIDIQPALNQLAERMAREYQGLFKSISADLADLVDNTALLKTQIGQLTEQNRLLMRAIQDVKCAAAPPLPSASGVAGASTPSTPAPSAPPIPPAPPKPRITVVGLLASQQQMILNEYSEVFDLKMFHTDDAQGASFRAAAENSAAVFTMVSFINHAVENVIKSMKGKVIRVTGGMTSLRDKLNDYFVNQTPKKEAT